MSRLTNVFTTSTLQGGDNHITLNCMVYSLTQAFSRSLRNHRPIKRVVSVSKRYTRRSFRAQVGSRGLLIIVLSSLGILGCVHRRIQYQCHCFSRPRRTAAIDAASFPRVAPQRYLWMAA
jgi:hypothetical protein